MKIKACPRCGSHRTIQKGKYGGDSCRDCLYMGNFFEFDTLEDYQKFYKEFKKKVRNNLSNFLVYNE